MQTPPSTTQIPLREVVSNSSGLLSNAWLKFFQFMKASLDPMGTEKSAEILNNKAVAEDILGLKLESSNFSQAIIEYLVQRITTGTGHQEIVTSGVLHAVYLPTSETWALVAMGTPGPSTSGLTFTVTATGQVRYTSTNLTGTESISRITYRVRTLAAKHYQYSTVGPGPIL